MKLFSVPKELIISIIMILENIVCTPCLSVNTLLMSVVLSISYVEKYIIIQKLFRIYLLFIDEYGFPVINGNTKKSNFYSTKTTDKNIVLQVITNRKNANKVIYLFGTWQMFRGKFVILIYHWS